jgi:hypothetical protein
MNIFSIADVYPFTAFGVNTRIFENEAVITAFTHKPMCQSVISAI